MGDVRGQDLVALPRFKNLPTEFLENNRVHAMQLTENGSLWIGTDKGLFYYNGSETKEFALPDVSDILITSILLHDLKLYIGTSKNIVILNPQNFKADYVTVRTKNGFNINTFFMLMCVDKQENISFFTGFDSGAYYSCNPKTSQLTKLFNNADGFRCFQLNNEEQLTSITTIQDYGITIYDLVAGKMRNKKQFFNSKEGKRPKLNIHQVIKDQKDILWCTSDNGLLMFNSHTYDFKLYPIEKDNKLNDIVLNGDQIFLATNNGLIIWSISKQKIVQKITHIPDDKYSLLSNHIQKLSINDSLLFVATDKGVSVLPLASSKGNVYVLENVRQPVNPPEPKIFKGNPYWLYSYERSVFKLNPFTKQISPLFSLQNGATLQYALADGPGKWQVVTSKNVYHWDGGNLNAYRWEVVSAKENNKFAAKNGGEIYIFGGEGFNRLNKRKKTLEKVDLVASEIYNIYSSAIFFNDSEVAMSATKSYIAFYKKDDKGLYKYNQIIETHATVNDWLKLDSGYYLLANNDGISVLDVDNKTNTYFQGKHAEFYKIVVSSKDTLLFSSNNVFKYSCKKIINYDYPLKSQLDITSPESIIYYSDTLYIMNDNKFYKLPLYPGNFVACRFSLNLVHSDTLLQDTLLQFFGDNPQLVIKPEGISYDPFANFSIKYCLSEIDGNWQSFDGGTISYQRLRPGEYYLSIRMVNNDMVLTEKKFLVRIIPVWYQTYYFLCLTILLAFGLVFILFRVTLKRIKRRAEKTYQIQRKINELEQKALRAQMNPHFLFNTLNSINNYILKKEIKEANFYLSMFARLIRLVLDNSQKEFISLQKELDTLTLYIELEYMRATGQFDYNISVDKEVDKESFMVPPMILQPFVENAIWHGVMAKGKDGLIEINIRKTAPLTKEDSLIVLIEDNGPGYYSSINERKRSSTYTSFGIKGTMERIHLSHKNNTCVISEIESEGTIRGTRITITIHN